MHRKFSYALVIAAMVLPWQAAIASALHPKVVVTVEPLKPYVDAILKGVSVSTSLLKPNQNPHQIVLSPSEGLALSEADVIIMPDRSMSGSLQRVLDQKKKDGAIVIELSSLPGADPLPYPKDNPWLEARKAAVKAQAAKKDVSVPDEDEGKPAKDAVADPHLWLDPVRMAAIAEPLSSLLGQVSPSNAVTLHYNAEKLATHLREDVDRGVRALLRQHGQHLKVATQASIPFITYHAAYQYFLARYDIAPGGFVTQVPEDYFGAHSLDKTLKGARAVPIRCIISESNSPLVKRLAAESGARVVTQNPERGYSERETPDMPWAANDYDRLLENVASNFAGCL